MPKTITEKGLERNVGNYAYHKNKEDGSLVLGVLAHNLDTLCKQAASSKRKVQTGDWIAPEGFCSRFQSYVVELKQPNRSSCYVITHCVKFDGDFVFSQID